MDLSQARHSRDRRISLPRAATALRLPPLPAKKFNRPNKQLPLALRHRRISAPGSLGGGSGETGEDGEEDDSPWPDEPSQPTSSFTSWREKQERRSKAFAKLRPELQATYRQNLPLASHFFESDRKQQLSQLQGRLDLTWQLHKCPSSVDGRCLAAESLQQVQQYIPVKFCSLTCGGSLNIPLWQCPCCMESFSPSPSVLGCFASSPSAPAAWYDLRLLQVYEQLGLSEGLSATGEAHESRTIKCTLLTW